MKNEWYSIWLARRLAASSQPQIPITAYAALWQWPINMPLSPQNKCKGSAKIRALINDGIQIRAWCSRRGNDSIVDTGTANRVDETDVNTTNCFLPSWFSTFSLTDCFEMWSIELNYEVNHLKSTTIQKLVHYYRLQVNLTKICSPKRVMWKMIYKNSANLSHTVFANARQGLVLIYTF